MSRISFILPCISQEHIVPLTSIEEFDQGDQMRIDKIVLEESADALLDRAADCFDLAKTQRDLAEKHHESAAMQQENASLQQAIAAQQHREADGLDAKADKLDDLGHALEANAVQIKGDTMVQRGT